AQLVIGDHGRDAQGNQRSRDIRKVLLVLRSPVPAMKKQVDRAACLRGREDIERMERVLAVANVVMRLQPGASLGIDGRASSLVLAEIRESFLRVVLELVLFCGQ